ncbi:MAG: DNA adenine methylase [Dysgonomonas sp.]|nr:DNA adenine methylase [Dysgonomonas sp.]
MQEEIKKFPTTRYQGSKRKILPWIYDCLKDIEFNTVLDAFGGSGMVSYLFKKMGKSVTFNDILQFNKIIGESIISNNEYILTDSDVQHILSKKEKIKTFIADNFQGIYYLEEENIWIDTIVHNIKNLDNKYTGDELKYKKAIAYNALFQSCLTKRPYNLFHRKNLEMRTRDVQRNFGNKTTWETPFQNHFKKFVFEINQSVYKSEMPCYSTNKDVFEIEDVGYDLVYIDSPYIKKNDGRNESSDYLKCYHFLEGISKYDDWYDLIDNNTINKRIKKDIMPNYFTPREALTTFERLIEKFQNSIIVISYKYGGSPSIEELADMLHRYKPQIRIHDKHYKYALNKQNGNAVLNREYILIGY